MESFKYFFFLLVAFAFFGLSNSNAHYTNCMETTQHHHISKEGADHITIQCEAFIKEKIMVKK